MNFFQNVIQKIKTPSTFVKSVFALSSASIITQVMPIFTAPILTRIYEPADYGILGMVMVITGLIGVIITLGYTNAIIIADDNDEAEIVTALCLKIFLSLVIVTTIAIIFFEQNIGKLIGIHNNHFLLLTIPISTFFGGFSSIFGSLANRYQLYKMLSVNRVIGVIVTAVSSIIMGLLFKNVIGLFVGFILGQIINGFILYITLKKEINLPSILTLLKTDTKVVSKKFKNFPLYSLPSDFINVFSNQIPVFLINSFSTNPQTALGHYNMSNRMLGMPIVVISGSIGEVFRQRAAKDYHENGTCKSIFLKTFKTLLFAAILPFFILGFWGDDIFAFAFGDKWREAGKYAQILTIMFFLRFIISPLTYVFFIAQKQKLDFILHQMFIVLGFLSLFVGFYYFKDINISLWLFSISYSIIYVVYFFFSLSYCKKNVE